MDAVSLMRQQFQLFHQLLEGTVADVSPEVGQLQPGGAAMPIGAPTFSPVVSRYLMAKMITSTTTRSAKNAVVAVTKKYRLSTAGAREEACSGNRGIPESIINQASGPGPQAPGPRRLAAAHQQAGQAEQREERERGVHHRGFQGYTSRRIRARPPGRPAI